MKPLVIAHRGASGIAPESTRAAIRKAARVRADMIELDVQRTRDGRLIVFHDDRLERTTTGAGRVVDATFAQLAQLDAGSWFGPRFAGERILLLSQVVELIPRWMRVNLELKRTTQRQALLNGVRRVLRRARLGPRLLLSSFDVSLIAPLRRSGLARALICRRNPQASLRHAIRLRCAAWHPHHTLATPARIAAAHAAGLRVHVWTVDDRRQAARLLSLGVDGLFTNRPERLRKVVDGRF